MEQVTVSSAGQIAIPKTVRDALDLKGGAKLNIEVRGHEIVLFKPLAWRALEGAGGHELMDAFARFKEQERAREDSRS